MKVHLEEHSQRHAKHQKMEGWVHFEMLQEVLQVWFDLMAFQRVKEAKLLEANMVELGDAEW